MTRLAHAWRAMEPEQRLAAGASLGLVISMFLPWYSKTVVFASSSHATRTSLNAFQAFSFVEAAVLLVSAGVLTALVARVEQRNFQLPGSDGATVVVAGTWTALLIFYRLLDKPGLQSSARTASIDVGVEWGIFIALLLAIGLAYAGTRMRGAQRASAHAPRAGARAARAGESESWPAEDRLGAAADATDGEEPTVRIPPPRVAAAATPFAAPQESGEGRPRYPPAPQEQLPFEDPRPGSE
jgi:hypothetical protein